MIQTVVVGLGRSGLGAARLLHASGHSVAVIDSGQNELLENKAEALRGQGIEVRLNSPLTMESFRPWLNDLQRVVISPGIPWNHPTIEQLRQHAVAVDGEMAVAWDALKHIPWVGITGTNGKTTVTHLLSHVLDQAGLAAPMGGNMGVSAADMALSLQQGSTPSPDWLVMELSSYQIEAADRIRPRIGIWTTLTPDHLERHGSVDAYRAIKRGLLERSDHAIFNADDPDLRQQRQSWTGGTWVSTDPTQPDGHPADLWIDAEGWVRDRTERLFPAEALAMPGDHNRQNMLLVTAAARQIGLSPASIEAGLRSFRGVPHRLEPLGCIGGTQVFNDSKATNYDAAAVGLRAMQGPVVVLAGGSTKQGDASDWLRELHRKACAVVLFGAGAAELKELITTANFPGPLTLCEDLPAAVDQALQSADGLGASSLLLSPACASFDQYRDFEARGDHFKQLIQQVQSGAN